MYNRTVVLGARDPEMDRIEQLAKAAFLEVLYAANSYGDRVNAHEAKHAKRFISCRGELLDSPDVIKMLVSSATWVECKPSRELDLSIEAGNRFDHHRPGQMRYELGAADYWMASSLGQFCTRFSIEPTEDLLYCAAADHCILEAYRGKCPGIEPNKMLTWRLNSRPRNRRSQLSVLMNIIKTTAREINTLPKIKIGNHLYYCATHVYLNELPEAALYANKAVIYRSKPKFDRGGLGIKIGVLGATEEEVRNWMEWANNNSSLTDVYGVPKHGYAGAVELKEINLQGSPCD